MGGTVGVVDGGGDVESFRVFSRGIDVGSGGSRSGGGSVGGALDGPGVVAIVDGGGIAESPSIVGSSGRWASDSVGGGNRLAHDSTNNEPFWRLPLFCVATATEMGNQRTGHWAQIHVSVRHLYRF